MIRRISLGLVVVLMGCAPVVSTVTSEARNWAFVQSVGGILIDPPIRNDSGGWDLPVNADVSGTRTITAKPTAVNSGLACHTSVAVEGRSIYVTVSTEVIAVLKRPECRSVHLEGIQPGKYMVYYRGPNEQPVKLTFVELQPILR